jgi:hypothetical protein
VRLNFVFFTDSVSELYGQRTYFSNYNGSFLPCLLGVAANLSVQTTNITDAFDGVFKAQVRVS